MNVEGGFSVWKECRHRWRLFVKIWVVAVICSCVVSYSIPSRYVSRAKISIDTNDNNPLEKGKGVLHGVKSMLMPSESNVLTEPRVYMDVLKSSAFVKELETVKVTSRTGEVMRFCDYVCFVERKPWWDRFSEKAIDEMVDEHVKYELNTSNKTITIQTEAQDPMVAYCMVDSVIMRLQTFMSEYMLRKAKTDFLNKKKAAAEMREAYNNAQRIKAEYADANFDVERQDVASKMRSLENEAEQALETYNDALVKLELSRMEMQRARPTFYKIVANVLPQSPLHPRWVANVLIWIFYGSVLVFWFIIYRKKFQIRLRR